MENMVALNVGLLVAKTIAILKGKKTKLSYVEDMALLEEIRKEVLTELNITTKGKFHVRGFGYLRY
ncbi:MAG: hypothetical protein ACK4FM_02025 [Caldimicrobium sp.]